MNEGVWNMKLLVQLLLVAGIFTGLPLYGGPLNLSEAYQKATGYDARLRASQADNQAYKEEISKARAQFRPNVRLNAARGRNATEHAYLGRYGTPDFYNTVNMGVSLRQPLFNLANDFEYKQAKAEAAKSDAELHKEEASLIVRITEAYCNALYADDNLEFSKAQLVAAKEQLQQAKRRYEKGFGTITEISEAQAGYDTALAEELEILNSVDFSRRELEHLTGEYPSGLCKIVPAKLVLAPPEFNGVQHWIDLAMEGNQDILGARQEIQVARREIQKQRAARYPTLDLLLGKNYAESENNYSIGSIYNTYSLTLQMIMPLYTGGYVSASVRQAQARWHKAGEQLSMQERGAQSDIRKYYNAVIASIAQIKAYEQAVKSHEIAFTGTKKGFEAGLRSNVDVLDAQQKLLASRRNLAKSRYQYILNCLMLKQSAGILSPGDIYEVNGWLVDAKP